MGLDFDTVFTAKTVRCLEIQAQTMIKHSFLVIKKLPELDDAGF